MQNKSMTDVTEAEFLALVENICTANYKTEHQHTQAVLEFKRLGEHPDGSDLIYYPKPMDDNSPEGIVKTVKNWRSASGKTGFKVEN